MPRAGTIKHALNLKNISLPLGPFPPLPPSPPPPPPHSWPSFQMLPTGLVEEEEAKDEDAHSGSARGVGVMYVVATLLEATAPGHMQGCYLSSLRHR